ncbi:hypothetical protein [Streptomyces paludis]|uniref:Ankyrin n=1 Tax=Streptomyces paludis TaxID=2282738 RepID=A0A345HU23_9ACTN|nr:hypothetical protein [Streptomyces paludis]AXG80197.1 hypothetical protein DVK44_23875 [Streptomyces paludis]
MDFRAETGASPRPDLSRTIEGDFETHLTVRTDRRGRAERAERAHHADRADRAGALADWAAAHGLRLTHVVLDRGRTPSRPTLTLCGSGSLDEQRHATERCVRSLAEAGFTVVRTRLAAAPWNEGVPRNDAEAAALPAYCRFEHRVTLRLPIPYHAGRLTAVVERHTAHLSRDARRVLPGGAQERAVTQRLRGLGRPEARVRLEALLDALTRAGFQPVDVREEFVLYDDNPAADGGWVEEWSGR